jgi:hypothetical protein
MTRMVKRPGNRWLVIDEMAVQSFIRTGGPVNDLLNDVARDAHIIAKGYLDVGRYGGNISGSHNRSGRLKKGVQWNRAKDTGPLTAKARLFSTARHTPYFMEGTRAVIEHVFMLVPKKEFFPHMTLSKGAGTDLYRIWNAADRPKRGRGFYRAKSVRGQRAKPFLEDAKHAALISHRLFPR